MLTVLVEDYFHVGAFEKLIQQRNWSNFERRYERNTIKTLDLLDQFGTKATFFVLGWIAAQNPDLVKEIADRGHEIASRGYYHRSLLNLTPDEFREDLRRTNGRLQEASGREIIGFRSAEKLKFGRDDWIFEILVEEGFAYDASFVPSRKGEEDHRFAHQIKAGDRSLWEFPYSTLDLGVGLLPISGGNYFRQIPYTLMRHAVAAWDRNFEEPFVFYFHIWELDPEQPRISAASRYNRVRHYRKLDKMEWIIKENLELYKFTDIAGFLGLRSQLSAEVDMAEPGDERISVVDETQATEKLIPITVIIPCYNEQEALPYLANTLRSVEKSLSESGYVTEFIFVDDCSKDDTSETLRALFGSNGNVQILRHEANKGVAAGIMTGLQTARTEIVCSMDCDCTYDPHELVQMLSLLSDDADMVTASPYHKDGGVRNVPAWRLFLSRGASFLYRRVLRSKMDTYTSCFRVYRKRSMDGIELTEMGFLGIAEMLGRLDLRGGKIVEYPTVLDVRLFGISKMKTLRTIAGHLRLLAALGKSRWFGNSDPIQSSIREKAVNLASENFKSK
ncbi:MAG: glycosyltransferase [Pyrinomonadaceae bacterium]